MEKVEVNPAFCKGCLFCVKYCPKSVFEQVKEPNAKGNRIVKPVHAQDCISCAMCATICPEAAITVRK